MEIHGVEELMLMLKRRYDASEHRHEWRALSGRDHVTGEYDTFVFSEDKIYQIKAVEISPQNMVGVGSEVGSSSPDLAGVSGRGSPVPLGVVSRKQDASAVVMFGLQQYSSDAALMLKDEFFSSKQDRLEADLKRRLDKLLERPQLRSSYRRMREDQESYFA
ncbi:MAG: hypothetical protein JSV90_05125 [Methanobacteriota archaeon]|nr:MAG: hypothetical protein JSV90_05125 [Euryarchaeota archaeon]